MNMNKERRPAEVVVFLFTLETLSNILDDMIYLKTILS